MSYTPGLNGHPKARIEPDPQAWVPVEKPMEEPIPWGYDVHGIYRPHEQAIQDRREEPAQSVPWGYGMQGTCQEPPGATEDLRNALPCYDQSEELIRVVNLLLAWLEGDPGAVSSRTRAQVCAEARAVLERMNGRRVKP